MQINTFTPYRLSVIFNLGDKLLVDFRIFK